MLCDSCAFVTKAAGIEAPYRKQKTVLLLFRLLNSKRTFCVHKQQGATEHKQQTLHKPGVNVKMKKKSFAFLERLCMYI